MDTGKSVTAARAALGCPEDGHWEIRTGRLALLHNSVPMRVGRRRGVKHKTKEVTPKPSLIPKPYHNIKHKPFFTFFLYFPFCSWLPGTPAQGAADLLVAMVQSNNEHDWT